MYPILSEIFFSGCMINSTVRRRTHLVQSFSVAFLYWLYYNSGSEEDLQAVMDQRKRKRMISNRESARRSRMRKQKHLDDLVSQVAQLRKDNQQILTSVNITTQQYLSVEAENSVLRAQVGELSHRLESLNEIIEVLNATTFLEPLNNSFFNPLNMGYLNHPIMASADILQY
ncbi:bZIP transcription factor 44, partial [Mucuna pruriens]